MSNQDKIIICTDGLTALKGAIRDMEIIPISIYCEVLMEDFRAGACDPVSPGFRVICLPQSLPFIVTHCISLFQKYRFQNFKAN